jgi:glycosyltransferase involved in cell wall biosynthesis
MSKAMKIAFILYSDIPDGGAVAHRVLTLGKGLACLGHEVHIAVPYKFSPGPLSEEIEGVKVHWGAYAPPRAGDALWGRLRKRFLLYQTARRLLRQGLDWLVLYDMGLDGLPFLLLARKYHCRVAADICDTRWLSKIPTMRELFYLPWYKLGHLLVTHKLQLIFVISRYLDNYLRNIAPQVPRVIIPAPVDLEKFKVSENEAKAFRRKFGLENSVIIGYLGSRYGVKGLEVLLRAAQKLAGEGKQFTLLITGNIIHNPYLIELMETLGLKDKAVLTGYLPKDELITAMSSADILVEPKIDHKANLAAFPQKLAEYLSMGKPVVASVVGDIPWYLTDNEDALLTRPGDAEDMAQALNRLIEDPALRRKLSKQAREAARKYFDYHLIVKRIESALMQVNALL